MRTPISLTLRTIGEGLKKDGEDTVQTPMPWTFLDCSASSTRRKKRLSAELTIPRVSIAAAATPHALNRRTSCDKRRAC